jgi:hypothetical protein
MSYSIKFAQETKGLFDLNFALLHIENQLKHVFSASSHWYELRDGMGLLGKGVFWATPI